MQGAVNFEYPCTSGFVYADAGLTLNTSTAMRVDGRGLHSSTFRLTVSTFVGIRWVHDFSQVYYMGRHGEL